MSIQYIRTQYQVPAKRGGRILFRGKTGRITGSRGAHLLVRLDGDTRTSALHPTWEVEYLNNVPSAPAEVAP